MSETINIIAIFEDLVSRPANRAARSLDEFGDEAEEAQRKVAALEATTAASTGTLDRHGDATERSITHTRRLGNEHEQTRQKAERFRRGMEDQENVFKRMERSILGFQNRLQRLGGSFMAIVAPVGRFLTTILKLGAVVAIAGLLGVLAMAIQGIAVAALAATAALGPLTGIVGALFGLIPTMIIGMGLLKLVMGGVGEAFSALMNPDATSEQIDKAMKKISANARQTLATVKSLGSEWKKVRESVQDNFFRGIGPNLIPLSNAVRPIVQKNLDTTATGVNTAVIDFMQWLATGEGTDLLDKTMQLGGSIVSAAARGLAQVMQVGMKLAVLATPLLNEIMGSMGRGLDRFEKFLDDNPEKVEKFFTDSWTHIKGWTSVLGDFFMGFVALASAAAPLTTKIGDSLGEVAENFRKWAEDPETQRRLRTWFEDMIPIVGTLVDFFGTLVRTIWSMGDGQNENFQKVFTWINDTLLPNLERVIKTMSETDALDSFMRAIDSIFTVLSDPAVAKSISDILRYVADLIVAFGDWFASLSPEDREFLVKLTLGLVGLSAAMSSLLPALAGVAGILGGGAMLGIIIGLGVGLYALWVVIDKLYPDVEKLSTNLTELIQAVAVGDWNRAWEETKQIFGDMLAIIETIMIYTGPSGLTAEILNLTEKHFPGLIDKVSSFFTTVWSVLTSPFSFLIELLMMIPNYASGVANTIMILFRPVIDMIDRIKSVLGLEGESVGYGGTVDTGVTGDVAETLLKLVRWIIPGRADGGPLMAGQLALVGERGPEATVDSRGNIGFVGLGGPHLYVPTDDVNVIPNEFLRSNGSHGAGNSSPDARAALGFARDEENQEPIESHEHLHLHDFTVRDDSDIDKIIGEFEKRFNNKKERR